MGVGSKTVIFVRKMWSRDVDFPGHTTAVVLFSRRNRTALRYDGQVQTAGNDLQCFKNDTETELRKSRGRVRALTSCTRPGGQKAAIVFVIFVRGDRATRSIILLV